MSAVTLITPTGDRPEAFALCERWMARQTFKGDVQWIVVDDGKEPTETHLGQDVIRLEPMEGCSLPRNLSVAIPYVQRDNVLVIEDDDYYAPSYVETMVRMLDVASIVGEAPAIYYHVGVRRWQQNKNLSHASLCQTGFRACDLINLFGEVCKRTDPDRPWIDLDLWRSSDPLKAVLFRGRRPFCVGIKGMPGRPGAGSGHAAHPHVTNLDPDGDYLRELLGPDAEAYLGFHSRTGL